MRATFHSLSLGLFLCCLVGIRGGGAGARGIEVGPGEGSPQESSPMELTSLAGPGPAEAPLPGVLEPKSALAGPQGGSGKHDPSGRKSLGTAQAHSGASARPGNGKGAILAVGGGGTPRSVIQDALRRARVSRPGQVSVVVLPYASSRENAGVASAEMWLEEGADAAFVADQDRDEAVQNLSAASIIWMSGGDQGRLLDTLDELTLVDEIRRAHRRGVLVGGTSAGAAVLGSVCIAGSPDPIAYEHGAMLGRPGLGLVADTIIDQHFRERRREGRLMTAVLDAGGVRGIGVSEMTAVWFENEEPIVAGEGVAVVFDARESRSSSGERLPREVSDSEGQSWAVTGIVTSILAPASREADPR